MVVADTGFILVVVTVNTLANFTFGITIGLATMVSIIAESPPILPSGQSMLWASLVNPKRSVSSSTQSEVSVSPVRKRPCV